MTRTQPVQDWENTQLWLDDLYSDGSAAPGTAEPDAAQPNSADDTGPEDVAGVDAPTPAAAVEPPSEATGAAAPEDGREVPSAAPPDAEAVSGGDDDEYGPWWMQEPPQPECHDYADFDPVDLDQPHQPVCGGGDGDGHRAPRRNGHKVGAATPTPADPDSGSGHVFDAADDHAWMAESATVAPPEPGALSAGSSPTFAPAGDGAENTPPRFNKTLALGFAATIVVGTIAVTSMLLGMRQDPTPDTEMADPTTQISVVAAPVTPTADPAVGADAPIPFVASADCPAGSTPAQSVAGDDPTRAWVCVRGGVDGQVLTLDLGRTMLVTAVSITPGWVGTDAAGTDQWLAHRVITKVQWVFDGDPSTVMTQTTGNIRGEAVQAVPGRGVLASKITMIVLHTSRPPADVPADPTPEVGGTGLFEQILPPAGSPAPVIGPTESFSLPGLPGSQTPTDPVDNTFAVSAIKILGHPPA